MMGALDNLVKGAAGQAVQNMNLLFGLPENEGLQLAPISHNSRYFVGLTGQQQNKSHNISTP